MFKVGDIIGWCVFDGKDNDLSLYEKWDGDVCLVIEEFKRKDKDYLKIRWVNHNKKSHELETRYQTLDNEDLEAFYHMRNIMESKRNE